MIMLLHVSCSMDLHGVHYRAQLHGGTRFVVRADGILVCDHTDIKYSRMSVADFAVKTKHFAEKTEREVIAPLSMFEE